VKTKWTIAPGDSSKTMRSGHGLAAFATVHAREYGSGSAMRVPFLMHMDGSPVFINLPFKAPWRVPPS
jgi:hypothetical protein